MRHPAVAIAIVAANHGDVKHVLTAVILYLLVNTTLTLVYMKWFKTLAQHTSQDIKPSGKLLIE